MIKWRLHCIAWHCIAWHCIALPGMLQRDLDSTPHKLFLKGQRGQRDLGKLIVAIGLKKFPKVKKIAQSGHTDYDTL